VTFHSLDFACFFLVTLLVYWQLPHRAQNLFLLVASYFFYGYVHPWFLILLLASTVVDYSAGVAMARWPERKRLLLGLSLASNLGLLGFFKYFNFFLDSVAAVAASAGVELSRPVLAIVLPVGISFYTFQSLTYTIGVYRGNVRARTDFIDLALFVGFFPPLVAGPIERAGHLLPQVEEARRFSWSWARHSLFLMLWGFFKKLVIADNVGVIANKVFALKDPGFEVLWAGVFAFGIQIYADFSAYSDIARGAAGWFGFRLMRNFDHPYLAASPTEFWRRWHISLSTWFRDYVYIPLGGSRGGRFAQARNVMLTFLVSGLWHGASWNFALWGAYHGLLLAVSRAIGPVRGLARVPPLLARAVQVVGMFILVNFGWLLFRETDTAYLLRHLTRSPFDSTPFQRQTGLYLFLLAGIYSVPLWIHSGWVAWRGEAPVRAHGGSFPSRRIRTLAFQAAVASLLVVSILALRSRTSLDFIYFQF
jgi:D-alanyl-lipoteichoic acid acyltransferase DltB (MBOAT superfamily)